MADQARRREETRGHHASQLVRKGVEEPFGWMETVVVCCRRSASGSGQPGYDAGDGGGAQPVAAGVPGAAGGGGLNVGAEDFPRALRGIAGDSVKSLASCFNYENVSSRRKRSVRPTSLAAP